MVDKELIEIWRNMMKPSISSRLLKTNYEGMGEQDKEEFERDFDEILDLALIGLKSKAQLSQEGTTIVAKSKRTFVELLVHYPHSDVCTYPEYKGKPYYSIKYIEDGECFVGFGTYKPEVLSEYLKEYFMPSAQPEERTENARKTLACDLISRQAAIDAIANCTNCGDEKTLRAYVAKHNLDNGWTGGVLEAIDAIEDLPPAQPEQRWIPCSERLPEEDHWLGGSGKQFSDNVLVSIYNSDDEDEWVDVSQTIDGEWRIGLPRHCKIVAWCELPKPYKEGGADEQ